MNQILFNKKNRRLKYIFKVQLFISVLIIIILIIYIVNSYNKDENLENISKIINKNIEVTSIYEAERESTQEEAYLGKIYIEKINLDYGVFNNLNEELLKIAPCKFYGNKLGEKGNICIVGHNYNDKRFFSRLGELSIKDEIILEDLKGKKYEYIIFDIFETKEDDMSVLKSSKTYELTLITCNNSNKKRIIVKAYMKEKT